MKIRDLFELDVTRDIPPVVYFHEQSPERVEAEVREYIITGGYLPGDPRARRLAEGQGIHEQFVRLLQVLRSELTDKPGGPELPGSWISGFFGSGKSSFAKLLGLAPCASPSPAGRPLPYIGRGAWYRGEPSGLRVRGPLRGVRACRPASPSPPGPPTRAHHVARCHDR